MSDLATKSTKKMRELTIVSGETTAEDKYRDNARDTKPEHIHRSSN